MRNKRLAALFLLCLTGLTGGCVTQSLNPLVQNEATGVPGLAMDVHAAVASGENTDQVTVTLYFRYLEEPMLAGEQRVLTVPRDQSVELAIVRALVEGPSAGHSELKRLLPPTATVESVTSRDELLFVTFDAGLLTDDIPADWAQDAHWQSEAPIQRRLAMQSIAASLTERFPYTGIQILVHRADQVQTDLRLQNSYFLTGADGLSEPIPREEEALLTPHNTVVAILTAWQEHDLTRLYRYIADAGRPPFATVAEAFAALPSLTQSVVSAGSVAADGQSAVVTVSLRTLRGGAQGATDGYPLLLTRENGVWKVDYARLLVLMGR